MPIFGQVHSSPAVAFGPSIVAGLQLEAETYLGTSLFSRALEIIVRLWEIIPFYGLKIQVSEIW